MLQEKAQMEENYEYLSSNIFKRLGFTEPLVLQQLKKEMQASEDGHISFSVKNQDKVEFEFKLDFNPNDERFYLNKIKGTLTKPDGEKVAHEFGLFFQRGYGEVEMENLLKGRAVYTERRIKGEDVKSWMKLDLNKLNLKGNHPEIHEYLNKSPFSLTRELSSLRLNISADEKESMIFNLKRGNDVVIFLPIKGVREKVLIQADPHNNTLAIKNDKGETIMAKEQKNRMEVIHQAKPDPLPGSTLAMAAAAEEPKQGRSQRPK